MPNQLGKTEARLATAARAAAEPSLEYRQQMAAAEARFTANIYRAQAEMAQAEVRLLRAHYTWISKAFVSWRRLLNRIRGVI